jgi:hypothetical protein
VARTDVRALDLVRAEHVPQRLARLREHLERVAELEVLGERGEEGTLEEHPQRRGALGDVRQIAEHARVGDHLFDAGGAEHRA